MNKYKIDIYEHVKNGSCVKIITPPVKLTRLSFETVVNEFGNRPPNISFICTEKEEQFVQDVNKAVTKTVGAQIKAGKVFGKEGTLLSNVLLGKIKKVRTPVGDLQDDTYNEGKQIRFGEFTIKAKDLLRCKVVGADKKPFMLNGEPLTADNIPVGSTVSIAVSQWGTTAGGSGELTAKPRFELQGIQVLELVTEQVVEFLDFEEDESSEDEDMPF